MKRSRPHVLAALVLLIAACTSSDDAVPAEPDAAIAAPAPETEEEPPPAPTSPYLLLSCEADPGGGGEGGGGEADAGTEEPAADAGAEEPLPDAAPEEPAEPPAEPPEEPTEPTAPEGIDDPCCNPTGTCNEGLECIEGPGEVNVCRPTCDLATLECPWGGICADFGGRGICIPAAAIGESCAPELCESNGVCVGSSEDTAVCEQRCEVDEDCSDGKTCTALNGSKSGACL